MTTASNAAQPDLWLLKTANGSPLANFKPSVKCIGELVEPDTNDSKGIFILLSLTFYDGLSEDTLIPYNEINKIQWQKLCSRCLLCPLTDNAESQVHDIVIEQLDHMEIRNIYEITRTGLFHINGTILYVTGEEIFVPKETELPELHLTGNAKEFVLDYDSTIRSPLEALQEFVKLTGLSSIGKILLAQTISGFIRSAFVETGYIPCSVLIIHGKTGMHKTAFSLMITRLYNRSKPIAPDARFDGTTPGLEKILERHCDTTVVFDDIHTAGSGEIRSKNNNASEEIIRQLADDTGRVRAKGGKTVKPNYRCNAVFTAEYIPGSGSTISRILIGELNNPPDGATLDIFQHTNKLIPSTVYRFFIQWYVDNYNDIKDFVAKKASNYRENQRTNSIHKRLQDASMYLYISYSVYLLFCQDVGFIDDNELQAELTNFRNLVEYMIQEQVKNYGTIINTYQETDYLTLISELWKNKDLRIAKSRKKYCPEDHDGFLDKSDNRLYIYGKALDTILPCFVPGYTRHTCVDYLLNQGALSTDKDRKCVKRFGKRFLALNLKKLEESDHV